MKAVISKKALFVFSIVAFMAFRADAFSATDSTQVSLLTVSQGDELYSVFGHSGIRLHDAEQGIDVVFNYGMFDFTRPGFYLNFCRGILIYSLGVESFRDFRAQYIYENRGVSEQLLYLSVAEKQELADFLVQNAQPENCDYRYDFLLDNCATRVRDVIEKILHDHLLYNTQAYNSHLTFRNLIDEYSWHKRWENFGMNLLIGLPVDRPTTYREQLFLPDYMRDAFQKATVGGNTPLVIQNAEIIPPPVVDKSAKYTDPEYVFSALLLFFILLTIAEIYFHFHLKIMDYLLFVSSGVVGLIMISLWLFTQHWTTAWNLNLLWALPTNLLLAHVLLVKRWFYAFKPLLLFSLGMEAFFIVFHALLPQPFQLGMVLISMILAIRLFRLNYKLRQGIL